MSSISNNGITALLNELLEAHKTEGNVALVGVHENKACLMEEPEKVIIFSYRKLKKSVGFASPEKVELVKKAVDSFLNGSHELAVLLLSSIGYKNIGKAKIIKLVNAFNLYSSLSDSIKDLPDVTSTRHGNVTDKEVMIIKGMNNRGFSNTYISLFFDIPYGVIKHINCGANYKNIKAI